MTEQIAADAAKPVSNVLTSASIQPPAPVKEQGQDDEEIDTKREQMAEDSGSTALGERYREFKESLLNMNSRLSIDQDEATDRYVYRSIHRQTGEVLHQWPREEILHMLKTMQEQQAHLIDETA